MTAGLQLAYLTLDEGARLLRCSRRELRNRILAGEFPVLKIGTVLRLEAQALDAQAPDPIPAVPLLTTHEIAAHWRVSPRLVQVLVARGVLGQHARGRRTVVDRRTLQRFVIDHTREKGDA